MFGDKLKRIEFENIAFAYNKDAAVFDRLSFIIENSGQEGLIVSLMGASGCGKSTLFKLLLGLVKERYGKIRYDIVDPYPVISYVPQEPVLFEHLSPLENATYFKYLKNYKDRFNQTSFDNLVKVLELDAVLSKARSINEISGGQKQRLSLLRALSIQPELVLLDEPCNGIDTELKRGFLIHLRKIITEQNIIAIYITHQPYETKLVSDQLLFMRTDQNDIVRRVYHDTVSNAFSRPDCIQAARFLFSPFINEVAGHFYQDSKLVSFTDEPNCRVIYSTRKNPATIPNKVLEFEKELLSVYKHDKESLLIHINEHKETNDLPFDFLIYDHNGDLVHSQEL